MLLSRLNNEPRPTTGVGKCKYPWANARRGIDPQMRSFAARPFVCVIIAICVAGLTLVVLMPGAQADAKPCGKPTSKPMNGQKVGWQRGRGPKHPAAKQRVCAPTGSAPPSTPSAEVSGNGNGVAPLSDEAEAAGPTLIAVPLARTALTGSVEQRSTPAATSALPATTPAGAPTTDVQVTAHSPAAIDDSVVLVGVLVGFILAVSGVVLGAGRRGGRRTN
jgi:hypothetical protein